MEIDDFLEVSFREVLQDVHAQLSQLSKLVSDLAVAHEKQLAQLTLTPRGSFSPPGPRMGATRSSPTKFLVHHGDHDGLEEPTLASFVVPKADSVNTISNQEDMTMSCEEGHAADTSPLNSELFQACIDSDVEEVVLLLEKRADPNAHYDGFSALGMDFMGGTPLTIAVLNGSYSLMNTLLQSRADVSAEYSFLAGAEQIPWSGPVCHATVPYARLDMLKCLLQHKADLHAQGSTSCSLLWQAAYFGRSDEMLEFLIEAGCDIERAAQSQDDSKSSLTPLHAASAAGHGNAVRILLAAKANPHVNNGMGVSPLEDAVIQGHPHVTQMLVSAGADLFHVTSMSRGSSISRALSRRGSSGTELGFSFSSGSQSQSYLPRVLDSVFASQNPTLMAAVASGLQHAPSGLLERLRLDDLVAIMSCPGSAPVHLLHAIFRPCTVSYWQHPSGHKKRRVRRLAAYIGRDMMNVAEGPHVSTLNKTFNRKETVHSDTLAFLDKLAPALPPTTGSNMYVPVQYYTCHVPMVHQDLGFIRALTECPEQDIFRHLGCQAIVNLKWQAVARTVYLRLALNLLEVLNLHTISFLMGEGNGTFSSDPWLQVTTIIALTLLTMHFLTELATAVGFFSCGLTFRYLKDLLSWSRMFMIALQAAVLALVIREQTMGNVFACLFGTAIFCKWLEVLSMMRYFEAVGLRVLPISVTMLEAGPFFLVLIALLIASSGFYYALRVHSFRECFIILFRIYALGDVDMYEMENVWAPRLSLPSWTAWRDQDIREIQQDVPHTTDAFVIVRVMFVILSFLIGVSLMNLYVAILCRGYVQAAESAWTDFMRCRAGVVLEQHALQLGLSRVLCCRRNPKRRLLNQRPSREVTVNFGPTNSSTIGQLMQQSERTVISSSGLSSMSRLPWAFFSGRTSRTSTRSPLMGQEETSYVWFAVPKELTEDMQDGGLPTKRLMMRKSFSTAGAHASGSSSIGKHM